MTHVTVLSGLVLALALAVAVWQDIKIRKIPNKVILMGTASAITLHAVQSASVQGALVSLAGLLVGLLLLLPFYVLKVLGAGDVKLMAMVGAFVGTPAVIGVTLLTMLAGGVLALVLALCAGQLNQVVRNVLHLVRLARIAGPAAGLKSDAVAAPVTGKLPYAIAIACGTAGHMLLVGSPGWTLFS